MIADHRTDEAKVLTESDVQTFDDVTMCDRQQTNVQH